MSDLTGKFEALEEQLDAADAATQTKLIAINAALDLINAQLDTQTINNAANTRFLLSALGTLNPCTDCEGLGVTVPPTDTTPATQNEELCQRVQAFLHAMTEVYTVLDTMSAFGVGFSTSILQNAFETVITALENGDTTPMPSFPEMVQIVGDGISYVAGNLFVGHTLVGLFTPLYFDLLRPMFDAGNGGAAQVVFDATMDGTDYSVFEQRLLKHAAYNSLYSYYFDPASAPNLTGYDGTLCFDSIPGITECTDYESQHMVLGGHNFAVVQVPPVSTFVTWGMMGDIFGFTFQLISGNPTSGVTVYSVTATPAELPFFTMGLGDAPRVIVGHPVQFSIRSTEADVGDTPFTVRICPPA